MFVAINEDPGDAEPEHGEEDVISDEAQESRLVKLCVFACTRLDASQLRQGLAARRRTVCAMLQLNRRRIALLLRAQAGSHMHNTICFLCHHFAPPARTCKDMRALSGNRVGRRSTLTLLKDSCQTLRLCSPPANLCCSGTAWRRRLLL